MKMAEGALRRVLDSLERAPEAEATDHEGVIHRLWVVQDEASVKGLSEAVGRGPLFIADGHHRFETAKAYRDEMRRLHPQAREGASFNYALSLIVSAADPALKILPTHRVVSGLSPEGIAAVEASIAESFDAREAGPAWDQLDAMLDGGARPTFGVASHDGRFRLLSVRQDRLPPADTRVDWLDVTVLRNLLLEPMTEIDPSGVGGLTAGPSISYFVDPEEAAQRVAHGEGQFAFFLRGTKVEQVIAVARAGERMPKKSTYFFPKAAAGLVISAASEEPL